MKFPDEQTLRAIADIQGNPNWEKVMLWVLGSLDEAEKSLHENTVFNAGRVAELHDLISKIETARAKYEEIQAQRKAGIK